MKSAVVYFLFMFLFQFTIANDIQKPILKPISRKIQTHSNKITKNRNLPEIEFTVDPINIMATFYDYMPGAYCKNPMQTQPEISQPYGYSAGGDYIAFHALYWPGVGHRRVFYAYINSEGELVETSTITNTDSREGFPGLDIDPITGDPFVTWHNVVEEDNSYDCSMTYDLYHINSTPGHWKEPFISIDNPEDSEPHTGHDDDEFIWPRIMIGPSPIDGKRRIYTMGNNYTSSSGGFANYNILVGYADFDTDDLTQQNELEFTYFSFPEWDDLHDNNMDGLLTDFAVGDDGKVAFVGYYGITWCMQYSEDYGETWTYYDADAKYEMVNPLNEYGSYFFVNAQTGEPEEIFAYPSGDGGHFNALFDRNNDKIIGMGAFGINTVSNFENGFYMPSMFYPKIYNYSIENGELVVDVIDLYIGGVDPNDGIPMVPWDLDENGVVDEFTEDGYISFVTSVPSWSWFGDAQSAFFDESLFKIAKVENYFIAIWQDAENVYHNYYQEPGYEPWEAKPEIAIAVSADNGVHWSQPAFMNANPNDENYYDELEGMIPAYVYTADEIKIVSETLNSVTLGVPIFFLDDYSYGSSIQGDGANEGGMLTYAKLEVSYQFKDIYADFQTDTTAGLAPLSVQFNDTSGGNVTNWQWDFDNDGTIDSYEQNPEHIYLESGNYSVALSVSDGDQSDTLLKTNLITVNDSLVADFQARETLGIAPFQVSFKDASIGNIELWQWDFQNDGTIDSFEQNPSHTYTEAGIYSVSLTVIDGNYSDREIHHNLIRIGDEFITDFEANKLEGELPLEVEFTDISSGGLLNSADSKIQNRDIVYWEWDFNSDGYVDSHEQNPTYIFEDSGIYTVTLRVSDGTFFDTETKIDFIEVKEPEIEATLVSNNFPNPFIDETRINFSLKDDSFVELIIFNLKGQIVRKLVDNSLGKGHYFETWDGKDQNSNDVQSGMFFYSLKCNNKIISTRKMIFMK